MIVSNLDLLQIDFEFDQTVIDENDREGAEVEYRRLLRACDLSADGKVTWHDLPGPRMKPLNFLFYQDDDVVGYAYFLDHRDFFVASIGEFRQLMGFRDFGLDAWLLAWMVWEARQRGLPDPVPEDGGIYLHDRTEYPGMLYKLPGESHVEPGRDTPAALIDCVFAMYEPHDRNENRCDLLVPNETGSDWLPAEKRTELPEFPSKLEPIRK